MSLPVQLRRSVDRYLTRRYLHVVLLGILLGQVGASAGYLARGLEAPFTFGDWRTYLSVVQMLRGGQGSQIYDLESLAAVQAVLGFELTIPYPYHPAFLLLVWPFTLLSPEASYVAWMLFNMVLLGSTLYVLASSLVPQRDRIFFMLLVFTSLPASIALWHGQSSCILLAALTLAVLGILRDNDFQTGVALAALLIKPQLLPLWIILLLWKGRLRALGYFALAALILAILSLLLVGVEGVSGYARLLTNGTMEFQYEGSHTLMGIAQALSGVGLSNQAYLLLAGTVAAGYGIMLLRGGRTSDTELRLLLAATVLASILVANYLLVYDLILWSIPAALAWPLVAGGSGRYLLAAGYVAPWLSQAFFQTGSTSWLAQILFESRSPYVWRTVTVNIIAFALLCWRGITESAERQSARGGRSTRWIS